MHNRRGARKQAFELLFEETFQDTGIDNILELAAEARDLEPDDFTLTLVRGTIEHRDEIDAVISRLARGRSISRLSRVVLCCLRLALFEIDNLEDIDVSISINEAVELAKEYSTQKEAGYVNGLLGTYVREKESGEVPGDGS